MPQVSGRNSQSNLFSDDHFAGVHRHGLATERGGKQRHKSQLSRTKSHIGPALNFSMVPIILMSEIRSTTLLNRSSMRRKLQFGGSADRSEERRVGKESGSRGRGMDD